MPAAADDMPPGDPAIDPVLTEQQQAGNDEIAAMRDQLHEDKTGEAEDAANVQRSAEIDHSIERRKAEMQRQVDYQNDPPPAEYPTNPTNITSPASHIPNVDTDMGMGEP